MRFVRFVSLVVVIACGDASPNAPDGGRPDATASDRDAGGRSNDGGADAALPDAGPPGEWQLEPGHFHPAVMPMTLVYPRPDAETATHARHRWAHPGMEYRIPAGVVQGGAWPFHYELVEGPSGATIGAQLDTVDGVQRSGPDYGVVRWTPGEALEGTTTEFVVRVTDQEGASVEARWTVTVDGGRFLFLSPEGTPANPGTLDAPMRDVADWYRGDPGDDTFADRIVVFREGSYTPIGQDGNENLRMEVGKKPMSYIGFPGETATLDATRASWTFWAGTTDISFIGLRFVGSRVVQPGGGEVNNARTISFYGGRNQDRVILFEVSAEDIEPGALGNDNPAFVWRPSSGERRGHHWAFVNNRFGPGGPRSGNGPRPVSISCVSYVVYEGNTVVDWHGTHTFGDKANVDHETQRNNDLWAVAREVIGPGYGLVAGLSDSYDASHVPGHVELAYNRVRIPEVDGPAQYAVSVGRSAIGDEARDPVWVYRNSIRGDVAFWAEEIYEVGAEGNVVHGSAGRAAAMREGDNLIVAGDEASPFDDATGELTGAARDTHLGTHGAEIR